MDTMHGSCYKHNVYTLQSIRFLAGLKLMAPAVILNVGARFKNCECVHTMPKLATLLSWRKSVLVELLFLAITLASIPRAMIIDEFD